ncbi:hypothetical protein AMS68_005624 [Peltaster fructicola]|uniref:Vacuolar import and degradation protein 21 n=1 Tax=Peltaster fructicola TaxID=286661 RepID=A0A6H0XZC8_9PEZI|nr:hypothetical protein AMS68_005624 [Peltaster fructicola]
MSIDVVRDAAIDKSKNEIESASRAQSASLLALHAVTKLLSENTTLSSLFSCKYDVDNTSNLNSDQLQFLKSNSLSHGHRFDEASLPLPNSVDVKISHAATPQADDSAGSAHAVAGSSTIADVGTASDVSTTLDPAAPVIDSTAGNAAHPLGSQPRQATEVPLNDIAPPEPEEEAQFDASTKDLLHEETPKRPAKTVHLPPEHVQEERLHDAAQDKSHGHADTAHRATHTHHELASSPSSTVGAYSTATPMPPQDSPDTSPDSESAAAEVPLEFRPTPQEQKAKDEHDRQLAAQKAVAHQAALGDVNTPDDQLHWEEREAAAREKEERAATTDKQGPEPAIVNGGANETQAEAFVNTKLQDLPEATVKGTAMNDGAPHDEESITVTPRANLLRNRPSATNSEPQHNETQAVERPMTGSTADRRRSSAQDHSPMAIRRRETGTYALETSLKQSPPRPKRTDVEAIFADLSALQGAAEDPEKDYLEPLFKIQAHDAPTIRTSALPDLIRAASKTISTDDQFTSAHERMEYRILRRIYHLQNANKWSLRQMEKCKEPAQPVSHHDHMMAEMRWMCKDFRAERKRKKSVCAWLAARCAEYVAADETTRRQLRVSVRASQGESFDSDDVPDLDATADSPTTAEAMPGTPKSHEHFPGRIIVDSVLIESVTELQRSGALPRALKNIPIWRPDDEIATSKPEIASVSKFVDGKILAKPLRPMRKRSRYDYEDEAEDDAANKRMRSESDLPPEEADVAIFHPDNKAIRDRLSAQNAFRPPSEFQMPSVPFYEFRNGSQWIVEDDQKLRRLARDYTFNWSIISDQLTLPSQFKSGMERRTPWECFERWIELEQMPAEMRKTMYFKTWYQRLEQSQQNVDKRYQAQIAQVQAQAQQSGVPPPHQPMRRRTVPSRVEKRKNTRYLWTVDAMRKNAKKRELAAYKQAEATRAAAQRKASQQTETQQPRQQMLTPQQFSQKRYERDLQVAEVQRAHRQKLIEAQQRQAQIARAAAQGLPAGAGQQQRPNGTAAPQAQVQGAANVNAQLTPQQRQQLQLAARNQAALGQANGQAVPQAQMTATTSAQQQNMQRMAAQMQARNGQFPNQQHQFAAMQTGNTASPGSANVNTQQQLASQQALLAAYQAQQQSTPNAQTPGNSTAQMAATPNMPPPPAPQQLSSGLVPAVIQIKNQLRAAYPNLTEDQLQAYATDRLQKQQSSNSVRQNAMAAAAGLTTQNANGGNVNIQAYNGNQANFQNTNGTNAAYTAPDSNTQNNSTQHSYAQMMRQRQAAQMRLQQSPNTTHAVPNGSPSVNHASPNMTPVSPAVQYASMSGQRPPSRSATPQMQRLGSSGSVPGVAVSGMQSPGSVQASPRGMQASMAR